MQCKKVLSMYNVLPVFHRVVWYGRKNDLEKYDGPNKELKEKQVKNWFIAAIAVTIFTVTLILFLFIILF